MKETMQKASQGDNVAVRRIQNLGKIMNKVKGAAKTTGYGALIEKLETSHDHHCHSQHPEALRYQGSTAKMDGSGTAKWSESQGIFPPEHHGHTPKKNRGTNGDDDQSNGIGTLGRTYGEPFQSDAHQGYRQHCQQKAETKRQVTHAIERNDSHAAKHDKLALSEVDDLGGIVNDGKTQGDNGVNRTVGDAGNDALENLVAQVHVNIWSA